MFHDLTVLFILLLICFTFIVVVFTLFCSFVFCCFHLVLLIFVLLFSPCSVLSKPQFSIASTSLLLHFCDWMYWLWALMSVLIMQPYTLYRSLSLEAIDLLHRLQNPQSKVELFTLLWLQILCKLGLLGTAKLPPKGLESCNSSNDSGQLPYPSVQYNGYSISDS